MSTPVRRAAVLGSPIAHSLSPALHNAAYAALGLDRWHYDRFEIDEAGLAGFVGGLGPEWAGLSLTMPLKRVLLDVADRVAPGAAAIGAGNTLVFGPQGAVAHNTDVTGIAESLRAAGAGTGRAVVLGAGGTAQAAVAALHDLEVDHVDVLVRDAGRAGALRETADRLDVEPEVHAVLTDAAAAARLLDGADVVVSTLPAGAADALAGARWRPGTVLLDSVYAPWPTVVAGGAAAAGATIVSGLEMLLRQAIAQVELMTGRPGPEAAMRGALDAAVLARG
ncbi:Shikimate 5-dehydrogenase I alpha [Pseudonocardia sp. Ae168_Ps1]|uniref:shikimate dehydrogenase n=1 Tax=unclassified Pseudonocardia TaxID=2619320 RepID=UPI00094ADE28|nr:MULTISPECIES: shikimate dehydrogenase [unclassified Pseudonocardia]OLL72667.1 Shikimate 5-dehydrogenase I alpha [Pseudonocardia sp. Ae150A_Ps1]OLL78639.1 Shikimate 5-dehydrogenase I alpha [Pseudonocardia sp. Ae168_Ps1]OLL87233.1 Shikimate 5-dehydrogenase I alpha [Pseudonocardia sp. Ae263_Ps1]OLL92737.1 Shikimate 5-dehydrogenase I alpha [Pseudonocardia sp. Ae356_Ps1]